MAKSTRQFTPEEAREKFSRDCSEVSEALEAWSLSEQSHGPTDRNDQTLIDRLRYLFESLSSDSESVEIGDDDGPWEAA